VFFLPPKQRTICMFSGRRRDFVSFTWALCGLSCRSAHSMCILEMQGVPKTLQLLYYNWPWLYLQDLTALILGGRKCKTKLFARAIWIPRNYWNNQNQFFLDFINSLGWMSAIWLTGERHLQLEKKIPFKSY